MRFTEIFNSIESSNLCGRLWVERISITSGYKIETYEYVSYTHVTVAENRGVYFCARHVSTKKKNKDVYMLVDLYVYLPSLFSSH